MNRSYTGLMDKRTSAYIVKGLFYVVTNPYNSELYGHLIVFLNGPFVYIKCSFFVFCLQQWSMHYWFVMPAQS